MKKLVIGLVAVMALSSTVEAKEGGNGGGIHWCPGKAPEMYDLYEGRRRFKLNIVNNGNGYEVIVKKAIDRVGGHNPQLASEIATKVKYLESEGLSLEENLSLTLVPDANHLMVDKNCEYRQLANWDEKTGKIFVDKKYYDEMDDLSKAALILHEAIYAVARSRFNFTNSDDSRKFVANLLSDIGAGVGDCILGFTLREDMAVKKNSSEGMVIDPLLDGSIFKNYYFLEIHFSRTNYQTIQELSKMKVSVPYLEKMSDDIAVIKNKIIAHENREARLPRKEVELLRQKLSSLEKKLENFKVLVTNKESEPLLTRQFVIWGNSKREILMSLVPEFRLVTFQSYCEEGEDEVAKLDVEFEIDNGDGKILKVSRKINFPCTRDGGGFKRFGTDTMMTVMISRGNPYIYKSNE